MKQVPFFANTPDDTHCVQAAFRIILKYFLPERDFSFKKLDQMSRKQLGKGTWWPPLLLECTKLGLQVKDIAPFDYSVFIRSGESYVRGFYPEEAADYHLNRTNLTLLRPMLPEFLKKVSVKARPATITDVKNLLAEGWLVAAAVNSRTLNNKPGFSGHVIVVFDFNENKDSFWIHDPGLPAHENRQVPHADLSTAINYLGAKYAALAAVKTNSP